MDSRPARRRSARAQTEPPDLRETLPEETRACAERLVHLALAEDVGPGDLTTEALIDPDAEVRARIVAREACVVCGVPVATRVFHVLDTRVRITRAVPDGTRVRHSGTVMELQGPARAILTGERVALNFLQRLSGIATLTRRFVDAVRPHRCKVLDTRKTTPGWRSLEKYAVRCGGGINHRQGLHDQVLIKDNHRAIWRRRGGGSLADAVRAARARWPDRVIEIEVDSPAELQDALEGRPDWVLLDNMTLREIRRCVRLCAGRARLEASGGITLRRAPLIAATGVDAISIGALTHSARSVDLSLEIL